MSSLCSADDPSPSPMWAGEHTGKGSRSRDRIPSGALLVNPAANQNAMVLNPLSDINTKCD